MLFDKVENGKIYGFNEDVLKQLITFYMNTPVKKNERDRKRRKNQKGLRIEKDSKN